MLSHAKKTKGFSYKTAGGLALKRMVLVKAAKEQHSVIADWIFE